jgi:hypothetical protein
MKRVIALLALVAAVAVAPGCAGADAQEAQALFAQSDAALAQVRSATFSAKLWTSGAPQDFTLRMAGGAYAKGKRAGDFYVVVTADGSYVRDVVVVQRGGRVTTSINGAVVSGVLPPSPDSGSLDIVKIDPYVKDVKVEHGKLIDGEPMTKVTGVVDTKAFLKDGLSVVSGVAQLGDAGLDFADGIGDTRAVFYISDVSHLPTRALVDIPMEFGGEKVVLHMDFAYTSFNAKLRFPGLR